MIKNKQKTEIMGTVMGGRFRILANTQVDSIRDLTAERVDERLEDLLYTTHTSFHPNNTNTTPSSSPFPPLPFPFLIFGFFPLSNCSSLWIGVLGWKTRERLMAV